MLFHKTSQFSFTRASLQTPGPSAHLFDTTKSFETLALDRRIFKAVARLGSAVNLVVLHDIHINA
jgi:hypothetical protein